MAYGMKTCSGKLKPMKRHWNIQITGVFLYKIHTYSSCSALSSLFTFVISSLGFTSNASKILNRYSITRKAKYVEASKSQSKQVVCLKGKKRPLANTVL